MCSILLRSKLTGRETRDANMLDLSSHVSRLSSNFPLYLVVFENLTHTLFLLHIMLRNHCTSGGEAYSYYYRSFSCFLAKIFPCAFLLREALSQTAEPPEPFASFAINVLFLHGILSNFIGPAARLFCLFSVFCGLNFRVFSAFRGFSRMIWLRPMAALGSFVVIFSISYQNRWLIYPPFQ